MKEGSGRTMMAMLPAGARRVAPEPGPPGDPAATVEDRALPSETVLPSDTVLADDRDAEEETPEDGAPDDDGASGDDSSEDSAPEDSAPEDSASRDSASRDSGLGGGAPYGHGAPAGSPDAPRAEVPLLVGAEELRARWQRIKALFVDNPQAAAAAAADVCDEATAMFVAWLREQRQRLRETWDRDGNDDSPGDTETLRLAVLGYQSIFTRVTRD